MKTNPNQTPRPRCADCAYAYAEEDSEHLQCRFHAPQSIPGGDWNPKGISWPRVQEEDWCGQWKLDPVLAEVDR